MVGFVLAMASSRGGRIPPRDDDAMAKKYCFKATGSVKVIRTGKMVASVIAYDKSPACAATVEALLRERAALDDGLDISDIFLTAYAECPAECDTVVLEYSED